MKPKYLTIKKSDQRRGESIRSRPDIYSQSLFLKLSPLKARLSHVDHVYLKLQTEFT